jgi:hypothetical protein
MQGSGKQARSGSPTEIREALSLRCCENAVFLGSGRSILDVSPAMWIRIINNFDIWTVNNWVYHPSVVPDFYHIECKWYNYELMQKRVYEKRKMYANCNFIFPWRKTVKMKDGTILRLCDVAPLGSKKFHYRAQARDIRRTHQTFNADYRPTIKAVTKSYDMSLTSVMELMHHFGYRDVILFGVDLKDSYYFWSDGDERYGEVHHKSNKEHEGKDPESPHATWKIKDFIVDFHRRHCEPVGRGIYVGHKNTLLYPDLELREI